MSVETYRELIGPSDRAVLEHANRFSENNVLHCCGWAGIPNHLEVWQDYPAKAINWACFIEDMDLTQGKAFFGGKCVLGGFDNRPCGVLSPARARRSKPRPARSFKRPARPA